MSEQNKSSLPGDPNCPICHGVGYVRLDVPPGHPQFGKLVPCVCRTSAIEEARRRRLFAMSHLDKLGHLTFETFKPHGRMGTGPRQARSIESAYNFARQFAENPSGWLLLMGGYGCGKTHLAAAIANYCVEKGISTLFLTVPDLLDNLRFAYDSPEGGFEKRFEQIRSVPLLILDDFGTQNATPWAQEKLFQILNFRYINRLPTVITTNLTLEEIEPRLRSRLQDPDVVAKIKIDAPDYRRAVDEVGHSELSALDLMGKYTFGNFSLREEEGLDPRDVESLRKAYNAAREFANDPRGWLVFSGPYGNGKTHLAAAIANYRAGMGEPPLFVSVPDLLDHLRATFSPNSTVTYDRRFEEIRTAPLLVLDDLGTQATTAWAREKLYQLFNYRYNAELPTVITTAVPLEEMDPRLRPRMLDTRISRIFLITAPPYYESPRAKRSKRRRKK